MLRERTKKTEGGWLQVSVVTADYSYFCLMKSSDGWPAKVAREPERAYLELEVHSLLFVRSFAAP